MASFDIGHVYFKHRDVFEYLYKTDISEIWEKGNGKCGKRF
jgi:hypothetical protein